MPRALILALLGSLALVGCGTIELLIPGSGCKSQDESRFFADFDIPKAKGCWSLTSGYPTDVLCLFDTVIAEYQARNEKATLRCSQYAPNGNAIRIGATTIQSRDPKTGTQTSDTSHGSSPFFAHTVVLGDTLVSFDYSTNPNSCSNMGVGFTGRRDPNTKFKAQIQGCDSLGYRTF